MTSVVNVSGGLLVVETVTSVAEGIGDLTINSFGQDVLNNRWMKFSSDVEGFVVRFSERGFQQNKTLNSFETAPKSSGYEA